MTRNKSHTKVRISMQSIADQVGVSRTTVSFVLNGKEKEGRISEAVANKIRAVARRENYQFNELARSLRTGHTRIIALIAADISDRFFATLAYHVQQHATRKGYMVVIASIGEEQDQFTPTIDMLINRQVDGMIVVPVQHTEQEISRLSGTGFPIVLADRYFTSLETSRVITNNYEASFEITSLLLEKGCKRIVLLSYDDTLMHMQERERGYKTALGQCRETQPAQICKIGYRNTRQDVERTIEKLFSPLREEKGAPIDAVLFATGGLAMYGVDALVRMGIPIGNRVQLACFDRADFVPSIRIPYVRQPIREMGERAVDILLNRIEHNDFTIRDCMLRSEIIGR